MRGAVSLRLTWGVVGEIDVEAFDHDFGIGGRLNLDDGGKGLAFGERCIGEEHIAGLGEGQLGGAGTVAGDHSHRLFGHGHDFIVFIHESDLDFSIFGDEELCVGFDGEEELSTVGTLFTIRVIMAFMSAAVLGSAKGEERKANKSDGEEFGDLFHGIVHDWFVVSFLVEGK